MLLRTLSLAFLLAPLLPSQAQPADRVMDIPKASADCMGAIKITDKIGPVRNVIGFGFIQEIENISGMVPFMMAKEYNPGWFRFSAEEDGDMYLTITSVNVTDDYNFALYQSPGAWFCQNFKFEYFPNPVRANASNADGAIGKTGLSSEGTEENTEYTSANAFSKPMKVKRGESYYLFVDSQARPQAGYTIEIKYVPGSTE